MQHKQQMQYKRAVNETIRFDANITGGTTPYTFQWKINRGSLGNGMLHVIDGDNSNNILANIKVQRNPSAVVVNPDTDIIYVANLGSDSVSVIDKNYQVIEGGVVVGLAPRYMAIDPVSDRIYVANSDSNTVSVIDGKSSNDVIQTISLEKHLGQTPEYEPTGLTISVVNQNNPNMNPLYVAMAKVDGDDTVAQSHRLVPIFIHETKGYGDEIPVEYTPVGLTVDSKRNILYVANQDSNTVSVVDTERNVTIKTIPVGRNPIDIAFNADKEIIYVANSGSNTVSVVDTRNSTNLIEPIKVGQRPWGLAYDNRSLLYVGNMDENTVSVINTNTGGVVGTIRFDKEPLNEQGDSLDIAFDAENQLVYVVSSDSSSIYVIRPNLSNLTNSDVTPIRAPNQTASNSTSFPVALAIDPHLNRTYIADLGSDLIWVYNETEIVNASSSGNEAPQAEILMPLESVRVSSPRWLSVDTADKTLYIVGGVFSDTLYLYNLMELAQ